MIEDRSEFLIQNGYHIRHRETRGRVRRRRETRAEEREKLKLSRREVTDGEEEREEVDVEREFC